MDRRNFLKRIAAVAAGAVVVPTVVKKLPVVAKDRPGLDKFKLNPAQKEIARMCNTVPIKGRHVTLTMWDEFAKVPVGTRFIASDGKSAYIYESE